ncbi:MAG: hypothetical protein HY906_24030 [Deltaproteobacteria bacterium]|nr:hypothetical protein [Deltaproteobacteria bacterium]
MRSSISDTSPAAERAQIALLRQAGPARRAELMRSLSRSVIELSREALRERMPGATDTEVMLRWVELNYGRELADRLRAYLAQRPP